MIIDDNIKTLFSSEARTFAISEDTRNEIKSALQQAKRAITRREIDAVRMASNLILTD